MPVPRNFITFGQDNQFLCCMICRNHILNITNRGYTIVSLFVDDPESPIGVTMLLDGIFCYNPVNVWYDDIANARYVHGLPVVEVHCMRCPSVLGEQYILRGQPGTVSPSPWEGPVILNHTALLYWNGSGFFFADDGTPLDD